MNDAIMKEPDRGCSITLSGKYNWNDVDKRAKSLGLIRSRYISFVVDKDISGRNKLTFRDVILFSLLMTIFAVQIFMILGVFNG